MKTIIILLLAGASCIAQPKNYFSLASTTGIKNTGAQLEYGHNLFPRTMGYVFGSWTTFFPDLKAVKDSFWITDPYSVSQGIDPTAYSYNLNSYTAGLGIKTLIVAFDPVSIGAFAQAGYSFVAIPQMGVRQIEPNGLQINIHSNKTNTRTMTYCAGVSVGVWLGGHWTASLGGSWTYLKVDAEAPIDRIGGLKPFVVKHYRNTYSYISIIPKIIFSF